MSAPKTCSLDEMCEHLAERCGDGGKGFKAMHTIDLSQKVGSATTKFLGVAYKNSAGDRGLMLNVCPFCGGAPGNFVRHAALPAVNATKMLAALEAVLSDCGDIDSDSRLQLHVGKQLRSAIDSATGVVS